MNQLQKFHLTQLKVFVPKRLHDDDINIDWDNPSSVSLIVDEVQQKLEGALRSSMNRGIGDFNKINNSDKGMDQAGKEEDGTSSPPIRFIRQITVTCGRGFYTFSSGATAPFLKIEYYDPSHRWRVKIMLEKGLELPQEYHPFSKRTNKDESHEELLEGDGSFPLLKFRCYEAHIPYTMQFFKVC